MSNASVDQVTLQARGISESEFSSFCESLTAALYTVSPAECIGSLRQLFVLLHSTKHKKKLPQQLLDALVKILLVPDKTKWQNKCLCCAILGEVSPSPTVHLPVGNMPWDDNQVPHVLNLATNQAQHGEEVVRSLMAQIVRWISTVGYSTLVQARAFIAMNNIASLYPQLLTKEQLVVVNSQLCEWLRRASVHQAPNPHSRGIFRKDDNKDPVTEVDGVATRAFFTVLCIGQYYSQDQLLNMYSYSLLRQWMVQAGPVLSDIESHVSLASHSSVATIDRDEGHMPGKRNSLMETALQYTLRLVEQCDRKAKTLQDAELQQIVLLESISILDELCLRDSSLIPKVFEVAKRVHSKTGLSQPRITIALMQFFFNHSEAVVYDAFQVYESVFDKVPSQYYSNPAVMFDVVMFIHDNLEKLCLKTPLLQKFFPSFMKILAWNPQTFYADYKELIPTFLSPTTTLEMFHSILDLPCLAATLVLTFHATHSSTVPLGVPQATWDNFNTPRYKTMFNFVLRAQAGFGDTIDRLERLHDILAGMAAHPRVAKCSEIVPGLLSILSEVILEEGDETLASNLVPALLERSTLLYAIPAYQSSARKQLSSLLVALFKQYPKLMTNQFSEIQSYVGSMRNIKDKEDFFIHVVWLVGEYLSPMHDPRCSPDTVSSMYEGMEILAYEVAGSLQSSKTMVYSPRLVTAIMSALAKLASRSQDLIPRVMLCLSKLSQVTTRLTGVDTVSRQAIQDRSSELLSLMKHPNVAAVILSPTPNYVESRPHRNNTSIPILLQTTSNMLQTKMPAS